MSKQLKNDEPREGGCVAVSRFIAIAFGLLFLGVGTILAIVSLQPSPPGGMVPNFGRLLSPVLTVIGIVIGVIGVLVVFAAMSGRR